MRTFFLIPVFMTLVLNTLAQQDSLRKQQEEPARKQEEVSKKNHLAVNASSFLEKVMKQNSTMDLDNSFLYYTRDFKWFSLRAGINGLNSSKTNANDKTGDKTIMNKYMTSVSLGILRTKELSRRFEAGYGITLMGAYADSTVTFVTTFDKVKNYSTSYQYGVAPTLLLKYKFSKRISAFAEYKLPLKMITTSQGTKYDAFPDFNSKDAKSTNYSLTIYNPILIYLSCSF
jgi:hypothetical protein